jgi:hypothetical protein
VRTYHAAKDRVEAWDGETRAWVFDLLENPDHRRRLDTLADVDLRRRAGCESCLRSLVLDRWTPETLHHVGWCDSCRRASIALGRFAAAPQRRRRAVLVALVAAVAIAAPLAGSQIIGGGGDNRGGGAQALPQTTPTTPGSTTPGTTPTTTPGSTTPAVPIVDPTPRSKPAKRGQQALPHTT